MPKGVEKDQLANSGNANAISSTAAGNANSLYGTLAPELQAESAHPGGYTPTQLAAQGTAAQQSAGGSQAATVGQAGLLGARTGNKGAGDAAIAAGQRTAGDQLSKAATGIQTNNAGLEQKQQQAGISGMENLYGTNMGSAIGALNTSNQALSGAQGSSQDNYMDLMNTINKIQSTAGGALTGAMGG